MSSKALLIEAAHSFGVEESNYNGVFQIYVTNYG